MICIARYLGNTAAMTAWYRLFLVLKSHLVTDTQSSTHVLILLCTVSTSSPWFSLKYTIERRTSHQAQCMAY